MVPPAQRAEPESVKQRYARRRGRHTEWNSLDPAVYLAVQEKERALLRLFSRCGIGPLAEKRLLEIGCGSGDDLLNLIRLGFDPSLVVGLELLEDRARAARHRLPQAAEVICGDAAETNLPAASFDVVMQSTVFTSLLDERFQERLADRMWSLVKPGGGVIWCDFVYDNPRNRDVRGVPVRRIRQLFPEGRLTMWRIALAPPISRRVTAVHPLLYPAFNVLPLLRTHALAWIAKPPSHGGAGIDAAGDTSPGR